MHKAYVVVHGTYDGDRKIVKVCLDKTRANSIAKDGNEKIGNKSFESFNVDEVELDSFQFCNCACCVSIISNAYEETEKND